MYTLHKTDGVILRAQEIGEADKLFTIFTRDFGKIALCARGVRLANSKLKGHLDILTRSRIVFVAGRETLRLTDAEATVNYLPHFSGSARMIAAAALRLIDRLVQGSEKDERLWELLGDFLEALLQAANPPSLLADLFAVRALVVLGYAELPAGELGGLLAEKNWEGNFFLKYANELARLREEGIRVSHL